MVVTHAGGKRRRERVKVTWLSSSIYQLALSELFHRMVRVFSGHQFLSLFGKNVYFTLSVHCEAHCFFEGSSLMTVILEMDQLGQW